MSDRHPTFESGEREQHLRHARECAACREKLLAGRPERLFMLLASEEQPAERLERLTADVMRQIEREQTGRRMRPRLRALVPVAASVALAGFFGIYTTLQQDGAQTLPVLEASAPSEGIELISSPGEAQVMEFTVGETQVVMIFDEAMDI